MREFTRAEIMEFIDDALLSQPQTVCVGYTDLGDGDVPIVLDTTEAQARQIIMQLLAELDKASLKTSPDWLKHFNIPSNCILDPDGWDRKNWAYSWYELISQEEFMSRVSKSTVQLSHPSLALLRGKYTTLLEDKVKV